MNPYVRAAASRPALVTEAAAKLEIRHQEAAERERARDEQGRFLPDDPTTPDVNEAWV